MARLNNLRHENYAQLRAEGMLAIDAYVEAGYTGDTKRHSHRMDKIDTIRARITELTQTSAKRHNVTLDTLLDELETARAMAMSMEQPSVAVQATLGKAKILQIGLADISVDNSVTVNGDAVLSLGDRELARRLVYLVEGGLNEQEKQHVIEHNT